jgi:hypothetical protein
MAKTPKKKRKSTPKPEVLQYPFAVVTLAQAFKASEDCGFALHDALLEAGYPGPASHFIGNHPCQPGKTCLVVEEILNPPPVDEVIDDWPEGKKEKPKSKRHGEQGRDLSDEFHLVCRDLEQHGVTVVETRYDGYGDSGTIEDITLFDRAGAEVPITKLGRLRYRDTKATANEVSLREKLEDLGYAILPCGWENNEGAFGTVNLNVKTRRIYVDHSWRVESTQEEPYGFEL